MNRLLLALDLHRADSVTGLHDSRVSPMQNKEPPSRVVKCTPTPSLPGAHQTPILLTQVQVYNTTFIRWTTHHPKGLSEKDIELATLCDILAQDFGETVVDKSHQQQQQQHDDQQKQQQQQEQGQPATACGLAGLANQAAGSAGDCCVPKGKGAGGGKA